MDVDEDHASRGAGLQVVVAAHAGPVGGDLADALDQPGVGAAVHQRVPGALADAQAADKQDRGGRERHDAVHLAEAEPVRHPQGGDGADIGDEVGHVMQRIRRDDAVAGPRRDPALPEDEAEGQRDGSHHDHDSVPLRGKGRRRIGRKPADRGPADRAGGDEDEDRLPERRQILDRGMPEGVILVGRACGIKDRHETADRHHQVERAVRERTEHGHRSGFRNCVGLGDRKDERRRDRGDGGPAGQVPGSAEIFASLAHG